MLNQKGSFLLLLILAFCLSILYFGCANRQLPQGGPKDVTPPKLLKASPPNMTRNFNAKIIQLDFDEFFKLSNQYRIQTHPYSCGPTSAAIVLNALRYNTAMAPSLNPSIRAYTPENFLNPESEKIKPAVGIYGLSPGLTLEELRKILAEVHQVDVIKEVAPVNLLFMKEILKKEDQLIIGNYDRSVLGQAGSGHLSPVAAYDELSDSFLILDVNPSINPWVWIGREALCIAMATFDKYENRGYLVIKEKIKDSR